MAKEKVIKKPAPETPYLAARREWNERYSSFIAAANNWRVIALCSVATSLVLAGGMVYVGGQQKVVPYAVQYNERGEVASVTRADIAMVPAQRYIAAALGEWVRGARSVYVDNRAMKTFIDKTYAMTYPDSACYQMLSNYHREHNPYQRAQNETVDVDVKTAMPIGNSKTWQVDWLETVKQRSGKVISTKQYQAMITTVIAPPTTEQQIMVNPQGIYAQECAWVNRQ
ncbi:VirB8/TrbF family protein [Tatumella sp. UCD-D_suzukii]|uniref:VirB8/TrbF family protein n=1 Tax=Tatumella sp. UCD-D_suzukii TaxID=1408192 RepID=UPI00046EE677|nr:VirB8/TrbF family protein [Tatumella sp. UCD-D_suzukii]